MLIDSGRSSIGVDQLLETESIEYSSFARRGDGEGAVRHRVNIVSVAGFRS